MRRLWLGVVALVLAAGVSGASAGAAPRALVTERAVLVMRHGIRAPLSGEVPEGTRTAAPWPRWSVADSVITPHGARALAIVAGADRAWLAARGLLAARGCPARGTVAIVSNSSDRTIASGAAYAQGLAPGCGLRVAHRAPGVVDPLFEPLRGRATAFDARAAVVDINSATGGMQALVDRHRADIALLDRVLGCGSDCVPALPPRVVAEADGHGITLDGAIRGTSGVAQVLLLQYLEGMPAASVGWGRADAATLQRLGALHAALFAVFTRPSYMAAHQASLLGRRIVDSLARGPRLQVLMGHDTNVTAVAAVLRVDLVAPGYATNDVPPGGALLFERVRDTRTGGRFIRVSYRTQAPGVLRAGGRAISVVPLVMAGCARPLCPADRVVAAIEARIAAPLRDR